MGKKITILMVHCFFFRPLIVTFTLQCPKLNVLTLSRVLGYGLLSSLVLPLL